MKTVDAARGKWHGILRQLGVDERYLTGKHMDCPLCGQGKDTFRFDDKEGKGTYFCGKCGAGFGMDFVIKWLSSDFKDAARRVDEILGEGLIEAKPQRQRKDPRILLRQIAKGAQQLNGADPASVYLRNRGLSIASPELKWHPSLTYWEAGGNNQPVKRGDFPAMVVPVWSSNGEPLTYHVTYLSQGQKAQVAHPKKVMTPLSTITGGAIRLFPAGRKLAVAEGIETALAFYEAHKIPVWATSNAGMMEALELPPEVSELTIVADNDASFTGQKAAYTLANRFSLAGGTAEVVLEGEPGQDYLDIFINKLSAA